VCRERDEKGRWWQDEKSQLRIKEIWFACNFAKGVV
jgi:hypothetical protein